MAEHARDYEGYEVDRERKLKITRKKAQAIINIASSAIGRLTCAGSVSFFIMRMAPSEKATTTKVRTEPALDMVHLPASRIVSPGQGNINASSS
jgi:hypothetical protein